MLRKIMDFFKNSAQGGSDKAVHQPVFNEAETFGILERAKKSMWEKRAAFFTPRTPGDLAAEEETIKSARSVMERALLILCKTGMAARDNPSKAQVKKMAEYNNEAFETAVEVFNRAYEIVEDHKTNDQKPVEMEKTFKDIANIMSDIDAAFEDSGDNLIVALGAENIKAFENH